MKELAGLSRVGVAALVGLAEVVESMHGTISSVPWLFGGGVRTRTRGLTGFVYKSIRGTTKWVGTALDAVLANVLPDTATTPERDALISALNGVLGDYLADTHNPLALAMQVRPFDRAKAGPRVVLLIHGSCMGDRQWTREGHDHGEALARDLGYTPLYLRYNSGRHVSQNGRELAHLLEALVRDWPVPIEELAIVGHSMGGLVARSACHYAQLEGLAWPRALKKLVFLGTPHHGSHLERGGIWIHVLLELTPYSAPIARLGKLRSAGVTDLRHGNVVDEHWLGSDRFVRGEDKRIPVPLPPDVKCYAIACSLGTDKVSQELIGDGLVPLSSALGLHQRPELTLHFTDTRQFLGVGIHHMALLSHPEVYAQLRTWLAQ